MHRFPPVQWLRHHPLAADCILAGLLTLGGMGALWFGAEHFDDTGDALRSAVADVADPNVWGSILVVGATAPLALRRRHPIAVLGVVAPCQFLLEVLNFHNSGWASMFIALYTVAAHTNGQRRTVAARVFGVGTSLFLIVGFVGGHATVGELVSSVVFLIGSYILGDNLQRRRRQVAEAAERESIAARERELVAHQQVQDERARIARELHDVVAHSVSLMIIQAGAARRSIMSSPLQAETALHDLETTGRHAMDELRQILGVLRAGDADGTDLAPQPTLASIWSLVEDDPSLHVEITEAGAAPNDVPASVGLSLYRVVQEALTNVRKHAGQVRRVAVHVVYEPHQISVEVTDDGRGASVAVNRGGHGLVGMRERMALCAGSVSAGPRQGGGWQVRASAPLGEVHGRAERDVGPSAVTAPVRAPTSS